jgi:hypothetical protein
MSVLLLMSVGFTNAPLGTTRKVSSRISAFPCSFIPADIQISACAKLHGAVFTAIYDSNRLCIIVIECELKEYSRGSSFTPIT